MAERRALVVGIDTYEAVEVLQKARNDAKSVAAALETSGFQTKLVLDPDRLGLLTVLTEFTNSLVPGDEVVFYFAGHGIEVSGRNYLLAADIPAVEPGSELIVTESGLAVDRVLDMLAAREVQVSVLILDACRKNPFPKKNARSVGGTRGLAAMDPPEGAFILYSAGSGQEALDRLNDADPNPNSVFTRILLPLLTEPGLEVPNMARRVRGEVRELAQSIRHEQFPAIYDQLDGSFALMKGKPRQFVASDPCIAARADWELVAGSNSLAAIDAYIGTHKSCAVLAALAKDKRKSVAERVTEVAVAPGGISQCVLKASSDYVTFSELEKSNLEELIAICRAAAKKAPSDGATLGALGRALMAADKNEEAVEFSQKGCDFGDRMACNSLGLSYETGRGVSQDLPKAVQLYTQACEAKNGISCRNLGSLMLEGKGLAQNAEQAVALFKKSCDFGHATGCMKLGWQVENGDGAKQDYERAVALYRQACDGGDATGCNNLGVAYARGRGIAEDKLRAFQLYQTSCDMGSNLGCTNAGTLLRLGNGVLQDYPKAMRLYQQACERDDPLGCNLVGYMFDNGLGANTDYKQAAVFFEKSCDAGNRTGCENLGLMYQYARGVTKDLVKATTLYLQSCDLGNVTGCSRAGYNVQKGIGATADEGAALALFQKACDGKDPLGCRRLGYAHANGLGTPRDDVKAVVAYRIAAAGGDAWGMNNLGFKLNYGNGVAENPREAAQWFIKAVQAGGQEIVDNIDSNNRNLSKATVAGLQSLLRDAGHYTGTIDGVYGSGTRAALGAAVRK